MLIDCLLCHHSILKYSVPEIRKSTPLYFIRIQNNTSVFATNLAFKQLSDVTMVVSCQDYGSLTTLSTDFSYIIEVNFIVGENHSNSGKPPTCLKPLTNLITYGCIKYTSLGTGIKFSTQYDWLARNQDNVSECGNMSICRLLLQ